MRFLSFDRLLDTVLEADQTQPYLPQPTQSAGPQSASFANSMQPQAQAALQQSAQTATFNPQGNMNQQMVQAAQVREKMQADNLANMPVAQKIELALQKATDAERIAYRTSRDIGDMNSKLDQIFKQLSGQISRVSQGQPAVEPDPPGSSIWGDDEEDPDSIWSR